MKLGNLLKKHRVEKGFSSKQFAEKAGLSRPYLSRIENGHETPAPETLFKVIAALGLNDKDANELWKKANYSSASKIRVAETSEVSGVQKESKVTNNVEINKNQPILYTDAAFVTKSNFGLVIDYAQSIASTNNKIVVSRVGMSIDHAKALLKVLENELKAKDDPSTT